MRLVEELRMTCIDAQTTHDVGIQHMREDGTSSRGSTRDRPS